PPAPRPRDRPPRRDQPKAGCARLAGGAHVPSAASEAAGPGEPAAAGGRAGETAARAAERARPEPAAECAGEAAREARGAAARDRQDDLFAGLQAAEHDRRAVAREP